MRRPITAALSLLVLAGCNPGGNPGGEAGLTPKERAAWKKYRQSGATAPDYRIALYRLNEKAWQIHSTSGDWRPRLEGAGINDLEEAQALARRVAGRPNIKAVALLEMVEEDEPQIVEWEVDDGRGAQTLERAPSAELERSLKEFILQLQRSISNRD